MFGFLNKLLDSNEKEVNKLQPLVEKINSLEAKTRSLKDSDFKKKTQEFKERLSRGETLDEILPEAFALVREASFRTIGQRHYDVQLVGGIVLHQGKIAEMKTGEGKTLVATLPLYLNALTSKGTHLVTVNDYLARRDGEWMGPIYHFLGLNLGVLNHEKSYLYDPNPKTEKIEETEVKLSGEEALSPEEGNLGVGKYLREVSRQEAYQADITYGTNNEYGFDYLRDNMVWDQTQMAQSNPKKEFGAHQFAIVDEVDSILIDEARTPLIISAPQEEATEKYYEFSRLVGDLITDTDYVVDEKLKTANLTEIGIAKVERMLGVTNLYEKDFATLHHIENALRAKTLFFKDRDYVVKEGEVIIVDEFTGRLMPGRRWSEGLHQAVEAKEGVAIQKESKTLATITFQNYFRMYEKLAGMTGTAATEAEEFHKIYNLDVVIIPTNQPMVREDYSDSVYKTQRAKYEAIIDEVGKLHQKGQPVLLGTTSIERNELLSDLLVRRKITHEVLNAKNHEREAQIIAKAGQKGAVTVATNMAGRGVDIKLGEGVDKLGGLHVIGSERHEARRIDNQLRGRSGRQGDPGNSRFYVSLQDDIMRLFGGDIVANLMTALKISEDVPIEHAMVSRAIENAQTKVEGHNFDIRKHLVEYDDVMNKQREIVYGLRKEALENKLSREEILEKIHATIQNIVQINTTEIPSYEVIAKEFALIVPIDESSTKQLEGEISKLDEPQLVSSYLNNIVDNVYNSKEEQLGGPTMRQIEKMVYLSTIDTLWTTHLDDVDDLREGIGLRGYGQRDPLVEYKAEAFTLFERLMTTIDDEIVHRLFRVQVVPQEQTQEANSESKKEISSKPAKGKKEVATVQQSNKKKPGRNDPCPCGSGKKFKRCGLLNNQTHQENMSKARA